MMGSDLQSSYQTAPSSRKLPMRIVNADLRSTDLHILDDNKMNEADDIAPPSQMLINEQQQVSQSFHPEGGSRDTDSRHVKENSIESSIKQVAAANGGFHVSGMERGSQETMHFE